MDGTNDWTESWFNDPECSEETEDGPVAKTISEYRQVVRRPRKWLDPWAAQACAKVLENDIILFKYRNTTNKWEFLDRVRCGKNTSKDPFVLFLQNGHFTTLSPTQSIPQHWKSLGKETPTDAFTQSFLGGGDLETDSSNVSNWLKPIPSAQSSAKDSVSNWLRPTTDRNTQMRTCNGTELGDKLDEVDMPKKAKPTKGKRKDSWTWICPECDARLTHETCAGLTQKKKQHNQTRHPGKNLRALRGRNEKEPPVALTKDLPADQLAWICPICNAGHPALPNKTHIKAVKHHIELEHPGETPTSLYRKISIGRPKLKRGGAELQVAKHAKKRKSHFKTHDPILLRPKKGYNHRGRVPYCKNCLTVLRQTSTKERTCKQTIKFLKQNPQARQVRRSWWNRLCKTDPDLAKELLSQSNWTKESWETFLAPEGATKE